jgi:hypothetical protein
MMRQSFDTLWHRAIIGKENVGMELMAQKNIKIVAKADNPQIFGLCLLVQLILKD